MVRLGLQLHTEAVLPTAVDPEDLALLNTGSERNPHWLSTIWPVQLGYVLAVAERTKRRPVEVAARLAELGLDLPAGAAPPDVVEFDDLVILSSSVNRAEPWLNVAEPVPLGHVLAAAEQTKRRPAEIAARLAELGLRLVEGMVLPDTVGVDDPAILSRDHDRIAPWLDASVPVPVNHVVRVANRLGRRPAKVAARLVTLGLRVAGEAAQLEKIELEDLRMFSDREDRDQWDRKTPVKLCRVYQGSVLSGRPILEVARRLRDIGFTLADDVIYADE